MMWGQVLPSYLFCSKFR